jgi:Co/Zn/Cd efflux system component
MLIAGIVTMYNTKGFWGLEHNQNANTMNNTLNTVTFLNPILIVVIVIVAGFLLICVQRGFG